MDKNKARGNPFQKTSTLTLLCAAVLLVIAAVTMLIPSGEAPVKDNAAAQVASDEVKVGDSCTIVQTLSYTRCEHVVTRRVTVPVELIGKTLADVQALYPEWQITEFSPTEIKMAQTPDIHCPDHMVLMPNGAGFLCVFQNKYGDGLALVSELQTQLQALPAAIQEELKQGVGFSTLSELESWLESVES